MTEHDRVLDAFRNCITEPKCKDCPWTECSTMDNGNAEIPRDLALAVMRELVAQEPRVMTLEEVKAAAGHDVWLELSGNIADDVLFATTIEGCGTKGLCTRYESLNYSAYGIRPYGWRCWTSRPDEKRREETPWN